MSSVISLLYMHQCSTLAAPSAFGNVLGKVFPLVMLNGYISIKTVWRPVLSKHKTMSILVDPFSKNHSLALIVND